MKNLREYMNRSSMGAKILVLTGLAAIVGGCSNYDNYTDQAIAGASIAKTAMQSSQIYSGQSERYPITGQSGGYTGQLSESHFDITGDGTTYMSGSGINVSKFVKKNRKMFKDGYEAEVYNAKTGEKYKIATGKFKKD